MFSASLDQSIRRLDLDDLDNQAIWTTDKAIDRALQVPGGAGLSQHGSLAETFAETRVLRTGAEPDEVLRDALD